MAKNESPVHDFEKQVENPDCSSARAVSGSKCVQCCKSAYIRAEQLISPLEEVMELLGHDSWDEIQYDVLRLIGSEDFDSIRESAVVDILNNAGFDVKVTQPELEAFAPGPRILPFIRKVRPKVQPEKVQPKKMPRKPTLPPSPPGNGTAQIVLYPGFSVEPVPMLQSLLKAVKMKITTRTMTKDCCDCVAKRAWSQSAPRRRSALKGGGSIMRRAPGGSKP